MAQDEARVFGDPFAEGDDAARLADFLVAAEAARWSVALSLTAARGGTPGCGRSIPLHDGAAARTVWTMLPDAALRAVVAAAGREVAETAPLLVFGDADAAALAGLEHPRACAVLVTRGSAAHEILAQLAGLPAVVERVDPEPALDEAELAPFLALPPHREFATFVHVGGYEPGHGTDAAVRALARLAAERPAALRVLLPFRNEAQETRWRALLARARGGGGHEAVLEFRGGPLTPHALADACGAVWCARDAGDTAALLALMASGRPLVAARHRANAALLGLPGVCLPAGGRWVPAQEEWPARFEPDVQGLAFAMAEVLRDPTAARATGRRARHAVLARHRRRVPAARGSRPRGARPLVVLEAPLLETSSSALLTIATARALHARGRVDLRLVPRRPFHHGLAEFRARAPELVQRLDAAPPCADLWLSAGWPPRTSRPECRVHAVRFDWEYGAVPAELGPLLAGEADRVVVHSESVRRSVLAAGRAADTIDLIPHGVDGAVFHERAEPLAEVLRFKRGRRAFLFVGGLIWRKGVDVLLQALAGWRREQHFCLVVKPIGARGSYAGYELGELVRRFAASPVALETLVLERELDAAGMAGLYRACDLLVHPYRGEGFALPVLEARACGLPVVATTPGPTDAFGPSPALLPLGSTRRALELRAPHLGQPWVQEPDAAALRVLLEGASEVLEPLRALAESEAPALRGRFTWEGAAARIEELAARAAGAGGGRDVVLAPQRAPLRVGARA